MSVKTESVVLKVDESEMLIFVARPVGVATAPGIMLSQEAFGVNDHIKSVATRLAAEGYVVAAPELFHRTAPQGFSASYVDMEPIRPHIQAVTTETLEVDLQATHAWLLQDAQTDKIKIASVGFCMGGRASFIANAILPIQAAVSFYGGGIAQNLLHLAPDQHAPMLFFWGGLDKHIAPELRGAVAAAMREANKSFVNVEFSDADHGFFCDARPAYNSKAAGEAWALLLQFLRTNL